MGVSVEQWRARIGSHCNGIASGSICLAMLEVQRDPANGPMDPSIRHSIGQLVCLVVFVNLLLLCGDVELNPGPKVFDPDNLDPGSFNFLDKDEYGVNNMDELMEKNGVDKSRYMTFRLPNPFADIFADLARLEARAKQRCEDKDEGAGKSTTGMLSSLRHLGIPALEHAFKDDSKSESDNDDDDDADDDDDSGISEIKDEKKLGNAESVLDGKSTAESKSKRKKRKRKSKKARKRTTATDAIDNENDSDSSNRASPNDDTENMDERNKTSQDEGKDEASMDKYYDALVQCTDEWTIENHPTNEKETITYEAIKQEKDDSENKKGNETEISMHKALTDKNDDHDNDAQNESTIRSTGTMKTENITTEKDKKVGKTCEATIQDKCDKKMDTQNEKKATTNKKKKHKSKTSTQSNAQLIKEYLFSATTKTSQTVLEELVRCGKLAGEVAQDFAIMVNYALFLRRFRITSIDLLENDSPPLEQEVENKTGGAKPKKITKKASETKSVKSPEKEEKAKKPSPKVIKRLKSWALKPRDTHDPFSAFTGEGSWQKGTDKGKSQPKRRATFRETLDNLAECYMKGSKAFKSKEYNAQLEKNIAEAKKKKEVPCFPDGESFDDYCARLKDLMAPYRLRGKAHEDMTTLYRKVAEVKEMQEDYRSALKYYQKVLRNQIELHGLKPDDETADAMCEIASCHQELEECNKALDYFHKSYQMWKILAKQDRVDDNEGDKECRQYQLVRTVNGIAKTHQSRGEHQLAIEFFKSALEYAKCVNQKDDIADILTFMGDSYRELDNWSKTKEDNGRKTKRDNGSKTIEDNESKTLECYQQALDIRRVLYGDQPHLELARSLNDVATATRTYRGANEEVLQMMKDTLAMRIALFGDKEPRKEIAGVLLNIGQCYNELGNVWEGFSYVQRYKQMMAEIREIEGEID